MPVTLEQLLQSREERVQHQTDLLGTHPGTSLVCLTVQLPGAEKRTPASLKIASAMYGMLPSLKRIRYSHLYSLQTSITVFVA